MRIIQFLLLCCCSYSSLHAAEPSLNVDATLELARLESVNGFATQDFSDQVAILQQCMLQAEQDGGLLPVALGSIWRQTLGHMLDTHPTLIEQWSSLPETTVHDVARLRALTSLHPIWQERQMKEAQQASQSSSNQQLSADLIQITAQHPLITGNWRELPPDLSEQDRQLILLRAGLSENVQLNRMQHDDHRSWWHLHRTPSLTQLTTHLEGTRERIRQFLTANDTTQTTPLGLSEQGALSDIDYWHQLQQLYRPDLSLAEPGWTRSAQAHALQQQLIVSCFALTNWRHQTQCSPPEIITYGKTFFHQENHLFTLGMQILALPRPSGNLVRKWLQLWRQTPPYYQQVATYLPVFQRIIVQQPHAFLSSLPINSRPINSLPINSNPPIMITMKA